MAQRTPDRATRKGKAAPPPEVEADDSEDEGEGDFSELAGRTVGRSDNVLAVARHLAEKAKARRQRDQWKAAYERLREDFPEDAIALVGDEAKAVEYIRGRNLDLGKLQGLLEKLETDNANLTAENLGFKARTMFDEFGRTSGYNVEAVAGAVKGEKLHSELADVTVDTVDGSGKKTGTTTKKTLMVRPASDPKAKLVPFDEYIDNHAKYLWPAIRAKPETNGQAQQPPMNGQPQRQVLAVEQGPSFTGTGADNPIAAYRQRRDEQRAAQKSPLQFGANNVATIPPGGRRGAPVK